jgi:anti-sigma factor RsiW
MRCAFFSWRGAGSIHPDLEILIRYADGELPAARSGTVSAHLERCQECRLEVYRLRIATQAAAASAVPASSGPEPALEKVLAGIRAWDAAAHTPGRPAALRRRVADEVAPYLGPQGAETVLASVSDGNADLLSNIEPVLALFLGCRAAASLVDHIVDATTAGA